MKRMINALAVVLICTLFAACSTNDDDNDNRFTVCPTENYLLGKWRFVEMLNGRIGETTPPPHTLEFKADSTVVIIYPNHEYPDHTLSYFFPEDQEKFGTAYPVIVMGARYDSGFQSYFTCKCDNKRLELHEYSLGPTTHEYIPATYVYERIAYPSLPW